MMSRLAVLALVLLAPACVLSKKSINEPLDEESIAALVPGVTTAAEVVELLGAPKNVVQLGHRSAYEYEHSAHRSMALSLIVFTAINEDVRPDRLWVFFDEDDVVTHRGASLAARRVEYAMPWTERKLPGDGGDEPDP